MIEGLLSISEDLLILSNAEGLTLDEKKYILDVIRRTLTVVASEMKKSKDFRVGTLE